MIFTSESSDKGSWRARAQEVNAPMPAVPQYLEWSDCSIAWSREDHPSIMPNPGTYPLVVDALFAAPKFSCLFSRVLIDGGSTINIYTEIRWSSWVSRRRILSAVGRLSMGLSLVCHAPL